LLVWITCTHLPNSPEQIVISLLGFSVAATKAFHFSFAFLFTGAFISGSPSATVTRDVAEVMDASMKAVSATSCCSGVCLRDRSPDCGARQTHTCVQ